MSSTFDHAQACYDAAEPPEYELAPPYRIDGLVEGMIYALYDGDQIDTIAGEIHRLSDRQATVCVWIDGHEYSLTLNRESDL